MTSLIIVRHLSKQFRTAQGQLHALQDISLEVEEGDIFGIIGQSGAGKSTLIRCLSSLERPSSGEILIENQDIAKMTPKVLRSFRQNIGMVFQHFNLLASRTVEENVAFPLEVHGIGKEEREKRVAEALAHVGLKEKRDVYPSHLSGGQKQRVGIARAIVTVPSVLFCDEATSALDSKTTRDILQLLKRLNQTLGLTIVLITHQIEVIKQICNKVAVLDEGRLAEVGSLKEVFANPRHPMTKQLLENSVHTVPPHFFTGLSPLKKLLRLTFKGERAGEPIISSMIKHFDVDVNILLGWIDSLQGMIVGNLVIELSAPPEKQLQALAFLRKNDVHCEELTDAG